ncbi:c-type cytochrome biogenesis protein CcmI [Methylocystis heyeri]|uniref:C-type cytochrome biogenesis protein CcmI n=1 Tax=Methylocystis heyeri TaxID=391905 RepID=A0A6B8KHQ0_9HYPH|nr:c-type cytochrome biogenesis protein CcmI [Methylocystis heyeri]QGM47187.1 c-type cytochrome biogenesis protein CcmI [Methylocystis heyeri]
MIWLVFALLTGAAVMAVLAPLARKNAPADASATDKAFFSEQIAEIERECAEGRLDPGDAEAARLEAARRLLRASQTGEKTSLASGKLRAAAAVATVVLVPVVALPLYLHLGSANLPDMPLAERLAKTPPHQDLSAAVAQIEAHLVQHPEDGRGFEVVAPFYLRNGRYEEAVHAFGEALRLLGATPTRHDALGEAIVIAAQGEVTPAARRQFDAALALDEKDAMARYYLGLGAAQEGESEKARDIWTKLLADAPSQAGYRDLVQGQLDKLSGGPAAEQPAATTAEGPATEQGKAIAALPRSQQEATIRGMVARLAERLAQKGDDVEGWLKLIRAYSVLSEPDKAKTALSDGKKALSGKPQEVARLDALAEQLNIGR